MGGDAVMTEIKGALERKVTLAYVRAQW